MQHQTTNMNTVSLIYDLPHIVALKDEVDRSRIVLDLPTRITRREPMCPKAADAYNDATRKYFQAIDDALAELKLIEASMAAAYGATEVELRA